MFSWFKNSGKNSLPKLRLLSKGDLSNANKVDLASLAPDIVTFLGLLSCVQLECYSIGSKAIEYAPNLQAKNSLTPIVEVFLHRYHLLTAEIKRRKQDPVEVIDPHMQIISDRFARFETKSWLETVLSIYVIGGIFDDYFYQLSQGVKDSYGKKVADMLRVSASYDDKITDLLKHEIEYNPKAIHELSLWGRRIVGDTLLIARSALVFSENIDHDNERIEPVFTDILARHSKRMSSLDLTP